jgi:hypothetical protein
MPLETNLRGDFHSPWPRTRRTDAEAADARDSLLRRLDGLLGFRPDWEDAGPVRSATVFSADGFARPFLQARSWSYRLKLPRLCSLELPQIWIPRDFDPVFHVAAPWASEVELSVASASGVRDELDRLMAAMEEEFDETRQVADRLRGIAAQGVEHGLPVIVEG